MRGFVVLAAVGAVAGCGGGEKPGTFVTGGGGGGSASAGGGVAGGGVASLGGSAAQAGGSSLGGALSLGGAAAGERPKLDMARMLTARRIKRRFSLGDRDHGACIVRAEGGIFCTVGGVGKALQDQTIDLVTMSGLGYCAISDDKSVTCVNASGDSEASKQFAAGVDIADNLMKSGDGLVVIKSSGAIVAWNGVELVKAQTAPGASLGGVDFSICPLGPDGSVDCFQYIPGDDFDRSQFTSEEARYVDVAQALSLFAGIDTEGRMRVRHSLEDEDLTYGEGLPLVQVAATSGFWCMLDNNGSLHCDAYDHQLPDGIDDVPSGEFLAVDVNESSACAVRTTGELSCWGGGAPEIADQVRID
jgi:hypothetical protein